MPTKRPREHHLRVALAVAFAVRALRSGSVCVDLTTLAEIAATADLTADLPPDLPVPNTAQLLSALRASPPRGLSSERFEHQRRDGGGRRCLDAELVLDADASGRRTIDAERSVGTSWSDRARIRRHFRHLGLSRSSRQADRLAPMPAPRRPAAISPNCCLYHREKALSAEKPSSSAT